MSNRLFKDENNLCLRKTCVHDINDPDRNCMFGTCNSQGECICSSKFDNISTASGYQEFYSCYQCERTSDESILRYYPAPPTTSLDDADKSTLLSENYCNVECVSGESTCKNGTCNSDGSCACYENETQGYWKGDSCDECKKITILIMYVQIFVMHQQLVQVMVLVYMMEVVIVIQVIQEINVMFVIQIFMVLIVKLIVMLRLFVIITVHVISIQEFVIVMLNTMKMIRKTVQDFGIMYDRVVIYNIILKKNVQQMEEVLH